jgi:PKHD-type hydroxylase
MPVDPRSRFQSYVVWDNAFTAAELDTIEALGDALQLEEAVVGYGTGSELAGDPVRSTRIAWMEPTAANTWIYQRLEGVTRTLNEQIYQYDLTGFSDPFQYSVYRSDRKGHFGWHADQFDRPMPRKLSFSLQLTDPGRYEGCDLEIFGGTTGEPKAMPRKRGALIAFPSYVMHRVTPIRSGIRKALVLWAGGPNFR